MKYFSECPKEMVHLNPFRIIFFKKSIPELSENLATEGELNPVSHFNQIFQHEFIHSIQRVISSKSIHKYLCHMQDKCKIK